FLSTAAEPLQNDQPPPPQTLTFTPATGDSSSQASLPIMASTALPSTIIPSLSTGHVVQPPAVTAAVAPSRGEPKLKFPKFSSKSKIAINQWLHLYEQHYGQFGETYLSNSLFGYLEDDAL